MTLYTATFSVAHASATEAFDAGTPEQALQFAQETFASNSASLDWQSYDPDISALEEITITDRDDQDCATWQSADLLLRLAAQDLLDALGAQTEAAQAVIDTWSKGDLAGAVRALAASIEDARGAIAKAKGGAP